jgi:uncharacterized membrane protein YoaK (UPF0700 family)
MEPWERVAHAVVKLTFIVFAVIVSLVCDAFGHGIFGLVIFVVGIVFGMLALTARETL